MSQFDPKEWQESIIASISGENLQMQAAAIGSAINFLNEPSISNLEKKTFIAQIFPMIEKEFTNPKSGLRSDCVKIILKIGAIDFSVIKKMFPQIILELNQKNRIITKEIVDFMTNMSNSNENFIQQAFSDIISNTTEWFNKPFLIPMAEYFYSTLLDRNYQFIHKNYDLLKKYYTQFPSSMKMIKQNIEIKLQEFEKMMKEEEIKKQKILKEEEYNREQKQKAQLEEKRQKMEKLEKMQEGQEQKEQKQKKTPEIIPKTPILEESESELPRIPLNPDSIIKELRKISPEKNTDKRNDVIDLPEGNEDEFKKWGLNKKLNPDEHEAEMSFSKLGLKKKN